MRRSYLKFNELLLHDMIGEISNIPADDGEYDDIADDADFDDNTYTYKHPEYPKTLEMENPWVGEELCKPENALGLKP